MSSACLYGSVDHWMLLQHWHRKRFIWFIISCLSGMGWFQHRQYSLPCWDGFSDTSLGMDLWWENSRTLPWVVIYWVLHPLRPKLFPRPSRYPLVVKDVQPITTPLSDRESWQWVYTILQYNWIRWLNGFYVGSIWFYSVDHLMLLEVQYTGGR